MNSYTQSNGGMYDGESLFHKALFQHNCAPRADADTREALAIALLNSKYVEVNKPDGLGDTPLHWASFFDHPNLASKLLERGADKNLRNKSFQTPLDKARAFDRKKCVDVLQAKPKSPSPVKSNQQPCNDPLIAHNAIQPVMPNASLPYSPPEHQTPQQQPVIVNPHQEVSPLTETPSGPLQQQHLHQQQSNALLPWAGLATLVVGSGILAFLYDNQTQDTHVHESNDTLVYNMLDAPTDDKEMLEEEDLARLN